MLLLRFSLVDSCEGDLMFLHSFFEEEKDGLSFFGAQSFTFFPLETL